uniref:Uncharacterized protein n=1 Tax=Timema monikensis TaxID=170555 RepID=A0A7R9ECZ4_9NEOP|nr:unnamed protein product [Timema monikensis]
MKADRVPVKKLMLVILFPEGDDESEQEGSVEQSLDQEEGLDLAEEGDGVSSEGEKLSTMEEVEEGREAEASEVPSLSNRTRSGTARRSGRVAFRSRSRTVVRPTPIVWNEPGSTSSRGREQAARALAAPGAPTPVERGAPFPRATRGRRTRGKPKAGFAPPYHMRF